MLKQGGHCVFFMLSLAAGLNVGKMISIFKKALQIGFDLKTDKFATVLMSFTMAFW